MKIVSCLNKTVTKAEDSGNKRINIILQFLLNLVTEYIVIYLYSPQRVADGWYFECKDGEEAEISLVYVTRVPNNISEYCF